MFGSKERKYDFAIIMLIIVGFAILRLRWGMADIDETFYLSIPFRLVQGDALLVEEWNLSQLSALLLYPIMKGYLWLFKSTEGIIVAFRLIYVIFQTIVTIISYFIIRKENRVLAIIISTLWFLFTPFNIMALSYNTMGLMSLWLVILLEHFNAKKYLDVIEGVLLAFCVLCNPYLVVVYFLFIVIALYRYFKYKDIEIIYKNIYITIGAGIVFLIFCFFVFSRASLEDILKNLDLILTSPAHEPKTIATFIEPVNIFINDFKVYTFLITISFMIGILKKNLRKYCFYLTAIISMILCVYLAVNMTNLHGYASIMIPLTPLGLIAFCYSKKNDWRLFKIWLVGIVYACCANLASNNGIYAIANACTVSSMISLMIIFKYLEANTLKGEKIFVFGTIVILQLFSQIYIYGNHVFWEEGPKALVSEIDQGPLKGVCTTEEKKEEYNRNYENLKYIKDNYARTEENILLFKEFPSGYLIVDNMRMGAYSAWLSDVAKDLNDERIQTYYEYHPQKTPQIIYIDEESAMVWEFEEWIDYSEKNGYELECFANGAYFLWRNEYD